MVRRELGTGRWDRILMRKMTELSVAETYEDAKEEWLATGRVWWAGNSELPEWVANTNHTGSCLCGHNVVYHFEIVNTENGRTECVGSDHINSYLIMRQIAEDLNVEVDTITDAQVAEWIKVRVGSMKEEAWWDANGDNFRLMFNKVKELDLYENVYEGDTHYSNAHRTYLPIKTLRKKSSGGQFGSSGYRMGSIVWRWNHPDNLKAQINTTGIPSDRLMQDLALLFVLSDGKIEAMNTSKAALRVMEEETTLWREEQRTIRLRYQEIRAEKQRLRDEEWERTRPEREKEAHERQVQRDIAIQKEHERTISRGIEYLTEEPNDEFINACGLYNIPVFDADFGVSHWEISFLSGIKRTLSIKGSNRLTSNQMGKLRELLQNSPTEKQLQYLKDLGYTGEVSTKFFASRKIKELTENDEK